MLQSERTNFKKFRKGITISALLFCSAFCCLLSSPGVFAADEPKPGDPASITLSIDEKVTAGTGSSTTADRDGGLADSSISDGTSVIYKTLRVTATHYNSYTVQGQVVSTKSGVTAGQLTLNGMTNPSANQKLSLATTAVSSASALDDDTWGLYWGSGTIKAPSSTYKINSSTPTTKFAIGSDSTPNKDSSTTTYTIGAAARVANVDGGKYSGSGVKISVTAVDIPYYRVRFNVNSLTGMSSIDAPEDQYVYRSDSGFSPTAVTLPTLTDTNGNYEFDGWCTNKVAADATCTVADTTPSGNKTYYAKWKIKDATYTVTYYLNGGKYSNSTTNPTRTIQAGQKPNLTTIKPTRDGYAFKGWCYGMTASDDCTVLTSSNASIVFSNTALAAKWVKTFTVTYNLKSGTYNNSTTNPTRTVENGTQIALTIIPSRSGYDFLGWCTSSSTSCAVLPGSSAPTVSSDITLYAKWGAVTGDKGNMQSITSAICNAMEEGKAYIMTDTRDSKKYLVSRLADGNCWMVQNLALEGSTSISTVTLTSSKSDLPSGTSYNMPVSSTSGFTGDAPECMYNGSHIDSANDSTSNTGGYYSWLTAVAGNTNNAAEDGQVAEGSICPKKWKLPQSSAIDSDDINVINPANQFDKLTKTYLQYSNLSWRYSSSGYYFNQVTRNSTNTYVQNWMAAWRPGIVGSYSNGKLVLSESQTHWWSSTAGGSKDNGTPLRYNLWETESNGSGGAQLNPGYSSQYTHRGESVRCVFTP